MSRTILYFSHGVIDGRLQSIVYVKRPNKGYRIYRLTRSSARRIDQLSPKLVTISKMSF